MFLPNGGFLPSKAQHRYAYDPEGRLREFNLSRQSTGGISDTNSLFATHAEHYDVVAPFLKANMAKNFPRRNYIVQPGGSVVYFGGRAAPPDPYANNEVQYNAPAFPDPKQSFGHNTAEVVGPGGSEARGGQGGMRGFSVGMGDRPSSR